MLPPPKYVVGWCLTKRLAIFGLVGTSEAIGGYDGAIQHETCDRLPPEKSWAYFMLSVQYIFFVAGTSA
ncbi:MAG: hypothetical protein QGH20_03760 [Candidatus Latescibacteria bacterium]|nr:hypothetical protein [Candidatus Latescibacterota bacterium]